MGIKNLTTFLKKHELYETFNISTLKYKKIGIDAPMFLYKFKSAYLPNVRDWLGCFITFITFLRKWDVHPIFVFEGKSPPEKAQTQEERREQRQKMMDKTNAIESDLNEYIVSGKITPLLTETWENAKRKNKSLLSKQKTLLTRSFVNVEDIKAEIQRRKKYEISITYEDIDKLKELLDIMGVSYIQSSGEAETDCVSLFYGQLIDYIVSEDTDVLAYFFPKNHCDTSKACRSDLKVITNFDTNEFTFTQVSKEKILETLNLTSESFRDFCIMCGTDYNKNIYRIGVEKSYKFVSEYCKIENIPLDTTILNHVKIRQLFEVKINPLFNKKVKWCRLPSSQFISEMNMFIFTNNLKNVNIDCILKALSEPDIKFD